MSDLTQVFKQVSEVFALKLGVPSSELLPELPLNKLLLDSLDFLELVVTLEQTFDLNINDQAFASCTTLADIATIIKHELSGL